MEFFNIMSVLLLTSDTDFSFADVNVLDFHHQSNDAVQCILVGITDDAIVEGDKEIQLTLSSINPYVATEIETSMIVIVDDDSKS